MSEHVKTAPTSFQFSLNRMFRQATLTKLKQITRGEITISDPFGYVRVGSNTNGLSADLKIHDANFYYLLAKNGTLGAAEGYIKELWDVDNLFDLVRIFALNSDVLDNFEKGTAAIKRVFNPLFHFLIRNSIAGSKRNIRAHYDLSNELFKTFLDNELIYSSAFFEHESMSLEDAQLAKLERVCRKLKLNDQDHVVEIGTGWGGFAIHAASKYKCKVTTTTISNEQFQYATKRIEQMGLSSLVTVLKQDYRELQGSFDKLVSIEMIEAVGADYLDAYLTKCSSLLKPEGAMLLQAITINDQDYHRAVKDIDFIKKYIFPGGFIPSLTAITNSMAKVTNLRLYGLEDMTPHYKTTLLNWQQRFNENAAKIESLGFDNAFRRMWNYYFAYCAGGFAERKIGSLQLLFGKPEYREDLSVNTKILSKDN